MKDTLGAQLQACMKTRLSRDRSAPDKILAELALLDDAAAPSIDKEEAQLRSAVRRSFSHWLLRFPSQCVLVTEAVLWARDVRRCLKECDKNSLARVGEEHQTRLDQYVSILRHENTRYLSSETRTRLHMLLGSLVNMALRHRDIIHTLLSLPEPTLGSFDWRKTLHYVMEARPYLQVQHEATRNVEDNHQDLNCTPNARPYLSTTGRLFGPCTVQQLGASFAYDYEYVGLDTPLVATPLSDRCQLTMTMALRSFQCGTVKGPEQAGKNETIRDLAKVMGRHLVTFNCNDDTNMNVLTRLLSGMVQTGSWVMYANLNHITEGLLSVFGQQLDHLCQALRILGSTDNNQYCTRGFSQQPRLRRKSLSTLHSSWPEDQPEATKRRASHHHRKESTGRSLKGSTARISHYALSDTKVTPEPHGIPSLPQRRHSVSKEIGVSLRDHYSDHSQAVPLVSEYYSNASDNFQAPWTYKPSILGYVKFNGALMPASSNFGCFVTLNLTSSTTTIIPDTLRSLMRPVCMVKPDLRVILQTALYCRGFVTSDTLGAKLCTFGDLLHAQLPDHPECVFGLRGMQAAIDIAMVRLYSKGRIFQLSGGSTRRSSAVTADQENPLDSPDIVGLEQDEEHHEEVALVHAIQTILLPRLQSPDHTRSVKNLLRSVFPWGGMGRPGTATHEHDPVLVDAVQRQFVADKLQATTQHVAKVLELYDSLKQRPGVILVGPSGSGKTVCRETLERALNTLHSSPPAEEEGRISPIKNISTMSADQHETQRPSALAKVRLAVGVLAKVNRTWMEVASRGAEMVSYPAVDASVIFPDALSLEELLGKYDPSSQSWRHGILTRLLRNASISASAAEALISTQTEKKNKALLNPPSVIHHWLVLDGSLNPDWTESIGSLLKKDCKKMDLGQGESLAMPDSCSIVFETTDLSTASPALISRCGVIHCGSDIVSWKSLTESWLGSAKSHWEITNTSLQMLTALIEDTFGPTIDFLSRHCQPVFSADLSASLVAKQRIVEGLQEVSSFLRIISALCDRFLIREEDDSIDENAVNGKRTPSPMASGSATAMGNAGDTSGHPNPTTLLLSMFAFSYIWGFGGHLHHGYTESFDKFARETLSRASFDTAVPIEGSVYDYSIDPQHGVLVPWGDRSQDKARTLPSGYTVIPEAERYFSIIDLLVSSNCPVLLTGPPGVGKTALVQNLVHPKHYYLRTNLSPGLTCQSFQNAIVSKLRPRSVAMPTVATGINRQQKAATSHLFFLDDLNCARMHEKTGSMPCVEVLRQIMVQGGAYDRQRLMFQSLEDANFIAACTPPGSPGIGSGTACHQLSSRLTRLFVVLSFFPLSSRAMDDFHRPNLKGWLEEYPAYSLDHHYEMAQALLSATRDLHTAIKSRLVPTPINPHYTFSLHDTNRVIQGLYLMSPHSRARPRQTNRHVGKARPQAAAGRSRRIMTKGGGGQTVPTAPPMMRTVIRLWCHEATRTYYDRVTSKEDEAWFGKLLEQIVEKHFCTGEEKPRTLTPVNDQDEFYKLQYLDSPGTSPPSTSPGGGSLPPTPCSFISSSLASDELEGPLPPIASTANTGTSSDVKGSISLTESGDVDSERDITSATPSLQSSAGSTVTEQSNNEEIDGEPIDHEHDVVVDAEPKSRQPSPPVITTHQPTPPSKASQAKTLTPALKDIQAKRRDGAEARLGTKGRSRGVHFQIGPVTESQEERYRGPLMSMEQIKSPEENLCDIIFAKYITSGQKDSERGYAECTEPQLFEGLQRCLEQYNSTATHRVELVFFKESVRHVAKLTRVFATQGANTLLIGLTSSMARSALVRLAAFAARCKLYDATMSQAIGDNAAVLRDKIRKASQVAGLLGKPAVLMLRGAYGVKCLEDVCAVMTEGSCPDLYTKDELDSIASQMLPGAKVTGHRNQRLEMALERFYRKVIGNLHVVVCMDCQDSRLSSLSQQLSQFPALLNASSCVDIYRPWSHEALVSIAEQWLRVPTADAYTRKTYKVPWSHLNPTAQATAISHAMAYVHRSATEAATTAYSKPFKFFSPLTYIEFLDLFKNLASKISKEEKATVVKYERALDTLNDVFEAMDGFNQELDRLKPLHRQAQGMAELRLQEVEECKAIFAEAKNVCNHDEEDIATIQEPLLDMKKQTQDELDKVNPVYEAALHALKSLNVADLDELRTYRAPPQAVLNVVNALCLMFREPYDWLSGKALINRHNFFQDLEFYDKGSIPDDIYHKLNVLFIQDPSFKPDIVRTASCAAASLCRWVHAVYAYANIHRNMRPKLQQVEEAEGKLHEAQGHLGEKRVKAQDVKGQLEEKVRQYKEAMRLVRSLERGIRTVEGKIARANTLLTRMTPQHSTWNSHLDQAHSNIKTAPGDALLTAASVCYQGPLDQFSRETLMGDWVARCRSGVFMKNQGSISEDETSDEALGADYGPQAPSESLSSDLPPAPANSQLSGISTAESEPRIYPIAIRENFTIEAILSTPDEQASWRSNHTLPRDPASIHSALFMRACCIGRQRQWPLLVDPDDQVMTWVKLLQERGVVSFHEGLALEEGSETAAALSIANLNEFDAADDSLSRETPTTKPTSRGTSTDEWDTGTDFPETPRTVTSIGGDSQYNLRSSINLTSDTDYDNSDPISYIADDTAMLDSLPDDAAEIQKQMENLWVIPADDPSLEIRLIQAVMLGVGVVVTHLERKQLGGKLTELLKRNVKYTQDGARRIVIGGREYGYRPTFCMYLCTSVPLELTGSGFVPLPIEDTSIIDLSISPQGLTDRLLRHVMLVERPEFYAQWRSIEGDILTQETVLQQAEDEILSKTLNLPQSLLDEPTMTEALDHYQQCTLATDASLHETHTLAAQLRQKQAAYAPVAKHGTLMYTVIKRMSALHPFYYVNTSTFVHWFAATIKSRKKDRADIGMATARAVELTNAIMLDIHSKIATALFPLHSQLFVFLVAVQKMRAANEVTEAEWLQFVGGASVATPTKLASYRGLKVPDWITPTMWAGCRRLERDFSVFEGLRESLVNHSRQWKEYFQHDPVLLAPVPGGNRLILTYMQKALLWRILRPDKMASICQDLTIYQLGSNIARPSSYTIEAVLNQCDQYTPVVFILPASYTEDGSINSGCEGHTYTHPTRALTKYCHHQKPHRPLHTLSMGTEAEVSRVLHALDECSHTGHWLLVDNFGLVGDGTEILQFVQKMVTSKTENLSTESRPQTKESTKSSELSEGSEASDIQTPEGVPEPDIHPDFRLFLITRADSHNNVPGLIVQHGIKVSCGATSNLRECLRHSFNDGLKTMEASKHMVTPESTKVTSEVVFCITLLHAVLSQRRRFNKMGFSKDYQWCESDFHTALDLLRVLHQHQQSQSVYDIYDNLANLRQLLGSVAYGGHVDQAEDLRVVQSIIDNLVVSWQDVEYMPDSMGVAALLASLLPASKSQGRHSRSSIGSHARRIQRVFDTMKDEAQPAQLGLMSGTPGMMETRGSRYICSALQTFERNSVKTNIPTWRSAMSVLESIKPDIDNLLLLEEPTSESLNYLEAFIASEIAQWNHTIRTVQSELALFQQSAQGSIALPPSEETLSAIGQGEVPKSWLSSATSQCTEGLSDLVMGLKTRARLLEKYLEEGDNVASFDLSAFSNPKMFLRCVLQEHARKEYVEIHRLTMQTELMNFERPPTSPPSFGIYINGLLLHNAEWDPKRRLTVLPQPPDPSVTPIDTTSPLPIVWFRPVVESIVTSEGARLQSNPYNCPVYRRGSKVTMLQEDDLLTFVDLPTTLEGSLWAQKRIFITL